MLWCMVMMHHDSDACSRHQLHYSRSSNNNNNIDNHKLKIMTVITILIMQVKSNHARLTSPDWTGQNGTLHLHIYLTDFLLTLSSIASPSSSFFLVMRWSKSTRRKGTSSLMFGSQCNFHLVVFTLPSRCSLPSAPEITGQYLYMQNTWRAGCWWLLYKAKVACLSSHCSCQAALCIAE